MSLANYIHEHLDSIVDEWEAFARTAFEPGRPLSREELRDHALVLLLAIIEELEEPVDVEATACSVEASPYVRCGPVVEASRQHARQRFKQGFTVNQMVAEYRRLRASVVRGWTAQLRAVEPDTLAELTRFTESVDAGMCEAIAWYSQRLDDSRNRLLGVIGHDLRTPLGAIQMSAQFLLAKEELTGQQTKAVTRILNSANNMRTLISDMLDFTGTLLGQTLPISKSEVDATEICQDVVDELAAFHPEASVTLKPSNVLMGRWDAARVKQMVGNLVANAIQFGAAGKTVTVAVQGDEQRVAVSVHNHGVPIPAQDLPNLFDPLRHGVKDVSDRHHGSSGLGLGLFIASEIAAAHGGRLAVLSTAEQGTTFTVTLPRRTEALAAQARKPDLVEPAHLVKGLPDRIDSTAAGLGRISANHR